MFSAVNTKQNQIKQKPTGPGDRYCGQPPLQKAMVKQPSEDGSNQGILSRS